MILFSKNRKSHIERELKKINSIPSEVKKSLNVEKEMEEFEKKVSMMHKKEIKLKDLVFHLGRTAEKMEEEIEKKKGEEASLKNKIEELKKQAKELEIKKKELENDVAIISKERNENEKALNDTNKALEKLKKHVEAFDMDIRD